MKTFAPEQDQQAQTSPVLPARSEARAKEAGDFVDRRAQLAQQSALLQMIDASPRIVQQKALADMTANRTGLPDGLKAGIESLSGMSMDHVRVHYNSAQPAQLNALAYAQGSEIHVGPAQEQHLAHEAWHVVQQAQGRVKPTLQMRDGVQVNDDHDLEHEADVMGAKALQMKTAPRAMPLTDIPHQLARHSAPIQRQQDVVQREGEDEDQAMDVEDDENDQEKELAEDIIRILAKRRIYIGDEEADAYAKKLLASERNTAVQVFGRHRALKLNKAGGLSSVHRRPPSSAHNMRVDPIYGPMEEKNASMIEENRFPLTGGILEQDVKIRASDLQKIVPRSNLRTVMGGSAAGLSNIQSSEWLHAIAHSLGGADQDHNLSAGPHALNTAMIPFETAVKQLVYDGKVVDYSVIFFTDTINDIAYIRAVEIGIDVNGKGRKYWTLTVDESRRDAFINGGVLGEIQGIASSFVSSHIQ